MKKKVFRERYNIADYKELGNVIKTFDEVVENPAIIKFVKEEVKETPKKRGRKKSVK